MCVTPSQISKEIVVYVLAAYGSVPDDTSAGRPSPCTEHQNLLAAVRRPLFTAAAIAS